MRHQILCFLSLLPLVVGQQPELRFSKIMDPAGQVNLRWDFFLEIELIIFQITAPTTGWVGFGLSPGGSMMGADIYIGGVNPDQSTYFGDYHGVGKMRPVLDEQQNATLISATENGTATTVRFSRKFRTCDPFDVDVTENTQRIIVAYGISDTLAYHGPNHRFLGAVQLLAKPKVPEPDPEPSFTHDIKMTNFPVPSDSTTYGCAYLPMPQTSVKIQIYKFEQIITKGNEDLIHHILVYGCPNSTNVSVAPAVCNNNTDFYPCRQVIAGWAVGGGAFTFPNHTGISLGTPADAQYVRIEIHYNNVQEKSGRTDSSGIRFYITSLLRPDDIGVLATGITVRALSFIPPRAPLFRLTSICHTDKFTQVIGPNIEPMKVFAELLHTHLAGIRIQVAHYRDGKQIGFLGRDMTYDFSLQEIRFLYEIITILVGDVLVVECTYNTAQRSNVTYGGLSTMSEMCLSFLYYYPRNMMAECSSVPDYGPLSSTLGFNIYNNPGALNLVNWTPENIELAQKATKESNQFIEVIQFNGSSIQDTGYILNITEPPVTPCNGSESSTTVPPSTGPYMSSAAPITPNPVPPCPNGDGPSAGHLCHTLVLLSTFLLVVSPFLDF